MCALNLFNTQVLLCIKFFQLSDDLLPFFVCIYTAYTHEIACMSYMLFINEYFTEY